MSTGKSTNSIVRESGFSNDVKITGYIKAPVFPQAMNIVFYGVKYV